MKTHYEVLSAILQHEFAKSETELLVLPATTLMPSFGRKPLISYLQLHLKGVEETTIRDYTDANRETSTLKPLFELTTPVIILTEEEQKAIFGAGGWDEFYRRYPMSRGQISVSRVGFNLQKTQALACVGIQSQKRSGYGSFFLMEKELEHWRIAQSTAAWIS